MKPSRGKEEIVLTGRPGNAVAVVPLDPSGGRIVPITIAIGGRPAIYRASVRPFGVGKSEIRLRLPVDTPPGRYRGEATIGGTPHPIAVEVEPLMRIRVQPKQSSFVAAASARVEFGVSIVNGGNVPFDVPKASAFDLDDAEENDRALGRSLRAPLSRGEKRVDRFFDELQKSHGGEARVAVLRGAGRIEPGESGELTCALEVPATAQPGHSYLGAWRLGNTGHVIVVDVAQRRRPKNGRAKA